MVTESLKLTEKMSVYKAKIARWSNHLVMDSPFTEDSGQCWSFRKLAISTCKRSCLVGERGVCLLLGTLNSNIPVSFLVNPSDVRRVKSSLTPRMKIEPQ